MAKPDIGKAVVLYQQLMALSEKVAIIESASSRQLIRR
jgi:hypothetical protein